MTEEMHNTQVSEPLVAGNSFCVVLNMDITMKGKGKNGHEGDLPVPGKRRKDRF
jgi:hypothetical protein